MRQGVSTNRLGLPMPMGWAASQDAESRRQTSVIRPPPMDDSVMRNRLLIHFAWFGVRAVEDGVIPFGDAESIDPSNLVSSDDSIKRMRCFSAARSRRYVYRLQ